MRIIVDGPTRSRSHMAIQPCSVSGCKGRLSRWCSHLWGFGTRSHLVLRPFAPSSLANPVSRERGRQRGGAASCVVQPLYLSALLWPSPPLLCHAKSSLWTTSPGSVSSVHYHRALAGAASKSGSAGPGVVGLPGPGSGTLRSYSSRVGEGAPLRLYLHAVLCSGLKQRDNRRTKRPRIPRTHLPGKGTQRPRKTRPGTQPLHGNSMEPQYRRKPPQTEVETPSNSTPSGARGRSTHERGHIRARKARAPAETRRGTPPATQICRSGGPHSQCPHVRKLKTFASVHSCLCSFKCFEHYALRRRNFAARPVYEAEKATQRAKRYNCDQGQTEPRTSKTDEEDR